MHLIGRQAIAVIALVLSSLFNLARAEDSTSSSPSAPSDTPGAEILPLIPKSALADSHPAASNPGESSALNSRIEHAADFQLKRPPWGVQFTYSPSTFGGQDYSQGQGYKLSAFQITAQYQPPLLQFLGVLSFGPEINIYPFLTQSGAAVTTSLYSLRSFGGQIRYQARYFREQILVPYAGLDFQKFSYQFSNLGSQGSFNLTGDLLGLAVLLNPFEPKTSADFYADRGILRTYLIAELSRLNGQDQLIDLGGNSYYFGLRMEF